jgi:hypothetical protein
MTSNTRLVSTQRSQFHIEKTDSSFQSIEEQPLPYTQATSSSENQKVPSVAESLPDYAAVPARADKQPRASHRHKKNRKWLFIFALVAAIIIGGILGGILSKSNRGHKATIGPQSPRGPPVTALAATECDAATIVVYQDDIGDIYLQGSLKNASWNGTDSPYIPSSKVVPNSPNISQNGTELSVVCYGGSINSTSTASLVSLLSLKLTWTSY